MPHPVFVSSPAGNPPWTATWAEEWLYTEPPALPPICLILPLYLHPTNPASPAMSHACNVMETEIAPGLASRLKWGHPSSVCAASVCLCVCVSVC